MKQPVRVSTQRSGNSKDERIRRWISTLVNSLYATPKAKELASKAIYQLYETKAFFEKDGRLNKDLLESELPKLAQSFLNISMAIRLGNNESDRSKLAEVYKAACRLQKKISVLQPPWGDFLQQRLTRRQFTITVKAGPRFAPLEDLIEACTVLSEPAGVQKRSKSRPDLEWLVPRLADLWSKVSGRKFNKTFVLENGTGDFLTLGPLFIQTILKCFDSTITPANIKTAFGKTSGDA